MKNKIIGIYKITNLINGKSYIGQSKVDVFKRWKKHQNALKTLDIPLYKAINKHKLKNFKFELIEECGLDIIDNREMYWIDYFDTYKNGYNCTLGGEGSLGFRHSLESLKKMKKNCTNWMKGKFGEKHPNSKAVVMLCKDKESYIRCFGGVREATRLFKERGYPNASHSSITSVLSGRRPTAFGYKWKYKEDYYGE